MFNVPLVFVDTETTGLSACRQTWEIAMIRDEPNGETKRYEAFLPVYTAGLNREANPASLRIGKFHTRYPTGRLLKDGENALEPIQHPRTVAQKIIEFTRGAHFVGMCPDFDARNLWDILRRCGTSEFPWYHQLIDVDILWAGYREALYMHAPEQLSTRGDLNYLPVDSDELSRVFGAKNHAPHTAMGDAEWTRDLYYKVLGRVPVG